MIKFNMGEYVVRKDDEDPPILFTISSVDISSVPYTYKLLASTGIEIYVTEDMLCLPSLVKEELPDKSKYIKGDWSRDDNNRD